MVSASFSRDRLELYLIRLLESATGSGKTLAFLIPVIERLLRLDPFKRHHIGAIVISPTRELASQIHSVLVSLLSFHAPSAALLSLNKDDGDDDAPDRPVEDFSFSPQTVRLKPQLLVGGKVTPAQDLSYFVKNSPNILVATPGRLLELLSSPHVHCSQSFEALILDEADRLLDNEFKDDLGTILQRIPRQRRTGLFSASVSEAVDQIIRVGLRNPVRISVKVKSASGLQDRKTPASLRLTYVCVPAIQRWPSLSFLFNKIEPTPQKSIIYVATCAMVDYFQHILPIILPRLTVVPLHGKHPPNVRQKNFKKFVESLTPAVLLTTDVAARGLDVPNVDLVIQMDPPSDPKVFIHRCGRAGRAGRKGLALTFLMPGREEDYIEFMRVRNTPLELYAGIESASDLDDAKQTIAQLRRLVLEDRALYDKAQRAFVSWVKSYSKHQATSIFRVTDLPWEELGHSWALLRLPSMPELKKWVGDRSLGLNIDFDNFAYTDKAREKHRVEELESKDDTSDAASKKKSPNKKQKYEAWSDKKEAKATREVRREKRHTRKTAESLAKMTEEERGQHDELQEMIQEVRKQTLAQADDFEGFSD